MISPAIHFNGCCRQAVEVYQRAFGATDIFMQLYDEAPEESGLNPNGKNNGLVMHGGMTICGTLVNFSDSDEPIAVGQNIALNVYMTAEQVKQAYDVLTEQGTAVVPIGEQFFSPLYAAVLDAFGVRWQLIS